METKKNPSKDINRKSFQFFCIGLIISTGLLITAFEWRTEKKTPATRTVENPPHDIVWVVQPTMIEEPKPLSPIKLEPKKVAVITPESLTPTKENSIEEKSYQLENIEVINAIEIPLPPEDIDTIVVFPEQKPEPINGLQGFYKMMTENMKYPRSAVRQNVEGRVFVEFVVDKKGLPSQMKVIKGIGAGCDEEAIRVLALSKWNPGKQRGNPVNVRMVIPIIFQLNR